MVTPVSEHALTFGDQGTQADQHNVSNSHYMQRNKLQDLEAEPRVTLT